MSVLSDARALSTTGRDPAAGTWAAWIEVLEAAIADYDRQLAGRPDAAVAPVFTEVPVPAGAGLLPPGLIPRTRAALDLLDELTRRTQERRDSVAGQLVALQKARHRQQADRSHTLGQAFDVSG